MPTINIGGGNMPKEHFLPKECPSTKRVSTDLFPFGAPAMGTQNYQYPTIMKQIMHELTLIVKEAGKNAPLLSNLTKCISCHY